MTRFCFCITTGRDGFLPDDRNYVDAACSVDAFDAIKDALRHFMDAGEETETTAREADWKGFFERGCMMPDASTWNFTLATDDDGMSLSLIGMTDEEFDRESAE